LKTPSGKPAGNIRLIPDALSKSRHQTGKPAGNIRLIPDALSKSRHQIKEYDIIRGKLRQGL